VLDTAEVEAREFGVSGGAIPFFRVICADSPDAPDLPTEGFARERTWNKVETAALLGGAGKYDSVYLRVPQPERNLCRDDELRIVWE
jgi:hypothetical protein